MFWDRENHELNQIRYRWAIASESSPLLISADSEVLVCGGVERMFQLTCVNRLRVRLMGISWVYVAAEERSAFLNIYAEPSVVIVLKSKGKISSSSSKALYVTEQSCVP